MFATLLKSLWRSAPSPDSLLQSARRLREQGRWQDALAAYQQLCLADAAPAEAVREAAQLALEQKQNDLAVVFLKQAIVHAPDDFSLQTNLAVLLKAAGDVAGAIAAGTAAMQLAPGRVEPIYNLALLRDELGEHEEAEKLHRAAIATTPNFEQAHNSLICLLDQSPLAPAGAALDARRHWAQAYPLPAVPRRHRNPRDAEKILNIGYVSADFRGHSSAYFLEALFAKHDPGRVKIHCYYNWPAADAVSRRLQSLVPVWKDISSMDDKQAAAAIEADGIDILVDLSGHTVGNRLGVFAQQVAPVQATYMGYLGSTGLPQIGYRISDAMLDPPGMTEHVQTEALVRTSASCVCFAPEPSAPPPNPLPALTNGALTLTFGSLNARRKLNAAVFAQWRRILLEVAGSRLIMVLEHGEQPAVCGPLLAFFAEGGVAPGRVSIRGRQSLAGFFSCLQECDLLLDPFPCTGGTTTFHSLWMGVPVITLAGDNALGRCGAMIMQSAGLPEFIAHSADEYVNIASRCAGDLPALAQVRAGLRDKFLAAPFADPARVARELEDIYQGLWRDWCHAATPD